MGSTVIVTAVRRRAYQDACAEGWLISLLAHGTIVFAALLFVKPIQLPQQPEPFRWDIALVSSSQGVSPVATLPDKAPPAESSTAPPPVMASSSLTTVSSSEGQGGQAIKAVTRTSEAGQFRAAHSLSSTADKLYQVVGRDGSMAFTNVPSDSRYQEKTITSRRLSTVNSTPARKTNVAGISPLLAPAVAKNDYAWLWDTILRQMVKETNGEICYRVDAAEGRTVMRLRIDEGGRISEVQVVQSSGHAGLDQNTVDILRQISPISLPRPLGQPFIRLQFPMTYRLNPQSYGPNWCSRVNG